MAKKKTAATKKKAPRKIPKAQIKKKQDKRSKRAKSADKARTAKNTFSINDRDGVALWYNSPGQYDILGIDSKPKAKQPKSKSKTKPVKRSTPTKTTPKKRNVGGMGASIQSSASLMGVSAKKAPAAKQKQPAYMGSSPFSSEQVRSFNSFSHYDVDINKDFNAGIMSMESKVKKKFPTSIPGNVKTAMEYVRKAKHDYYLESSRARAVAPPVYVVGPANYKGKPDRAHRIRGKAIERTAKAESRLEKEIKKAQKQERMEQSGVGKYVQMGDSVTLYWTNCGHSYQAAAKVTRVNERTIVGTLTNGTAGYPAGHKISVPIYGTKGNRFEKAGQKNPFAQTERKVVELEGDPDIKVGTKVKVPHRGTGTVTKVNKQTYKIRFDHTPSHSKFEPNIVKLDVTKV